MNDYGLYKAIREKLLSHPYIRQKLNEVSTHIAQPLTLPALVIDWQAEERDDPLSPQLVRLNVRVRIFSEYKGLRELSDMMSATSQCLERQKLILKPEGYPRFGYAILRLQHQHIENPVNQPYKNGESIYLARIRLKGEH